MFSTNQYGAAIRSFKQHEGLEHSPPIRITRACAKIDPMPDVWTGAWRDTRSFNPEGSQPENALTGTIFTVNAWRNDPIIVPAEYARLRFWRHTGVARLEPGERAVLLKGLLGHEWDEDLDNGFRPPGLFRLSETTIDNVPYVQDCGSVFRLRHRHPPPHALPPRERRPRLRSRHGAMGMGPRRPPRHRDRGAAGAGEREHDAGRRRPERPGPERPPGHGQPLRRHGGPARDARAGPRPRGSLGESRAAGLAHRRAADRFFPAAGLGAGLGRVARPRRWVRRRGRGVGGRRRDPSRGARRGATNGSPKGLAPGRFCAGRSTTAATSKRPPRASPSPCRRRREGQGAVRSRPRRHDQVMKIANAAVRSMKSHGSKVRDWLRNNCPDEPPGVPGDRLFEPPMVRGPAPAVAVFAERYETGFTRHREAPHRGNRRASTPRVSGRRGAAGGARRPARARCRVVPGRAGLAGLRPVRGMACLRRRGVGSAGMEDWRRPHLRHSESEPGERRLFVAGACGMVWMRLRNFCLRCGERGAEGREVDSILVDTNVVAITNRLF